MFPSLLLKECQNVLEIQGKELPLKLRISTDTRSLKNSNTFLCLYGLQFDGHRFIDQAIEKGIEVVFAESSRCSLKKLKNKNISLVFVKNTFEFLQELAGLWSRHWQASGGIVIGLTGSSGKTTNKEMLAHLFKVILADRVHWTKGNLNNHIGVPLTLLDLKDHHQLAIIEMGTNHPGEIELLCRIADPSVGLITNIGPAHLEFLEDLEGVFQEKTALFRWVKKHKKRGPFVIFSGDPQLASLKNEDQVISFGPGGNYQFQREGNCLKLDNGRNEYQICNDLIHGNHNFINLAQTFLLAASLFPEEINVLKEASQCFEISDRNRGFWHELQGRRVFLDAYNANPSSVKASFQGFVEETDLIPREDILIVLGDMNELGKKSVELHEDLGKYIKDQNYPNVVFVGRYAKCFQKGLTYAANTYDTVEEFKKDWPIFLRKHKIFFLKASRALQLESCLDIND